MNTTLWIVQGLVAAALIVSGTLILVLPKATLAARMSWINAYSDGMRRFICLSKIAGGIGLTLPMALGVYPALTLAAAAGTIVLMLLAIRYHISKAEYKDLPANVVFIALATAILVLRWDLAN